MTEERRAMRAWVKMHLRLPPARRELLKWYRGLRKEPAQPKATASA